MTLLTAGVGAPSTISFASGGRNYAFNAITTSPQQILGSNPVRQRFTVHNPGTVDIFIAPLYTQTSGSDVLLAPTTSALGGCIRVFANGGTVVISGECQKPYQAFSASGTGNPLTVDESNV